MIDCDPCKCVDGHYRDEHAWRKAMITLLCDIETALENYINLENLWDKSLGVIYPHISTDSVLIPASLSVSTDTNIGGILDVGAAAGIGGILTVSSDIIYKNVNTRFVANTADAADTALLSIHGGGADGPTRGANIYLAGNERAAYTGSIQITSGNVAGSRIEFLPGGYVGWRFSRTASDSSHDMFYGRSDIANSVARIKSSRADGSDDSTIHICGGGSESVTRGSFISLAGNEASTTGRVRLYAGDVIGGVVEIYTQNVRHWTFPRGNAATHEIIFGDTGATPTQSATIRAQTADGDDDGTLQLSGGGAIAASRGSYAIFHGNEINSGRFILGTGDKADSSAFIRLNNSLGLFYIQAGTNTLWSFEYDGDLQQNGTNGGDLIFNRAGKGVCEKIGTLAAAGSTISDAAQIVARITIVSDADGTKGVKLPSNALSGAIYTIINTDTTHAVWLYPASVSHHFVNMAGGDPGTISSEGTLVVMFDGTDTWYFISQM